MRCQVPVQVIAPLKEYKSVNQDAHHSLPRLHYAQDPKPSLVNYNVSSLLSKWSTTHIMGHIALVHKEQPDNLTWIRVEKVAWKEQWGKVW